MLPIHFAPLQGFTESAYRRAHARFARGIHTYYTPFIREEKGAARAKDLKDLTRDLQQGELENYHVVPQIIFKDLSEFEILTRTLEDLGFREIDLNMGCPYPMQTKSGRGSGLLPHPEKIAPIFKRIQELSHISFSVKMRLGLHSANESFALIPILNETPLSHVTMHPRLGEQQYKGELHLHDFENFANKLTRPLIYNGDLTTVEEILAVEKKFPSLTGIMIGRGLLARPTLAQEYATGKNLDSLAVQKQIHAEVLKDYSQHLEGGDAQILQKI
ncbi:MAG: tRNA-dihydrouridine synthase family protein, partial [Fibrobacter sp.]|nr:tRNA-dihydrouridine synthase family protein [Fibrobacter sp.]